MKRATGRQPRIRVWLFLAGWLAFCVRAEAHIVGQINSVHFHSAMPDFGTPPRLAIIEGRERVDDRPGASRGYAGYERVGVYWNSEKAEQQALRRLKARKKLLRAARNYEMRRQWNEAGEVYRQIGRRFGWTGDLSDRIEVFKQLRAMKRPLPPAFVKSLERYLKAMAWQDHDSSALGIGYLQDIYRSQSAGFLRPHALYQIASVAYKQGKWGYALSLYRQLLDEFPKSVKREATLIMIARSALLPGQWGRDYIRHAQDIPMAEWALGRLRREFPGTRFRRAALGLEGRIHFIKKRYAEALRIYFALNDLRSAKIVIGDLPRSEQGTVRAKLVAAYLRNLSHARSYEDYAEAVRGIDRQRQVMSASDAYRFAQLLLRTPELAAPYFYYRLYLCSNQPKDRANLARLADRIVSRYPSVSLSPAVRTRLAEVYYQRRQYGKSLEWASAALQGQASDRALYARGSALHKLGRFRPAIADYARLLRRFPGSPLTRGAHEQLAILYEADGDIGNALRHYFILDYCTDIAFLLDARMTLAEIEQFLKRYPKHPQKELVLYSLGVRYLRANRLESAERAFLRLPAPRLKAFARGDGIEYFEEVRPHLRDPLQAVRDLKRLDAAVRSSPSSGGRAEAMYSLASYYYKKRNLLLYNPMLWQGNRMLAFDFWWNERHADARDVNASRRHHYEHECLNRARLLCLQVARRYPRSSAAPKALYRAACATFYLGGMNAWWREEDSYRRFSREAIHLMREVARRYPRHRLAPVARKYARAFAEERRSARLVWPSSAPPGMMARLPEPTASER